MLVNDFLNRPLEIDDNPKRIISLCPSQTETLIDMGVSERIVGITRFCIHPKDVVSNIIQVGGTKNPNIEKIKELKPDLILCEKEENRKEDVDEMMKFCPVFVTNVDTFASSLIMIHYLGRLVGAKDIASNFIKVIKQKFEVLENTVNTISHQPSVAYLIWKSPYMAAGNDTFINSILRKSGFHNVFHLKEERYPIIEIDEIINHNPAFLFLSSEPYPFKEKHLIELKELLPNTTIMLVDGEMFSWYGTRQIKAADYLINLLKDINYPQN